MTKTIFLRMFAVIALMIANFAHAQLRVEIAGVGANQIPIAIAAFGNETVAPSQVSAVIKADLARSGYFRIIDTGNVMTENTPVNYADWKGRGANALVVGSVTRLPDGRFDVKYRLFDSMRESQLSSMALSTQPQYIRVAGHKIADDIYQKLLGVPGAFATRIAYVTKSGREYRLEVADSDGEGVQVALRSNEPIISPAWSPDGTKVAYVSFENKKPVVYVQNLVTKQRTVVANFKGSNSAPAWSPDGSKLAVALSRSGSTQIYMVNADGSSLRRLSNSNGIDTEPQFSGDGKSIYFTSDRSGGPQIYKMSVAGGDARRVTFSGAYNISPRISPDGKYLAYISQRGGKFQLYLLDLSNNQEMRLSDTTRDESPSFSPNSRYILYATSDGGRGNLAVVSVDGTVRQRLSLRAGGNIQEPTWGPFMK
jgi:TolB protein